MQKVCITDNDISVINSLPLSRAYIPSQCFTQPVSPKEALEMGTAWQELYMPYKKGGESY